MKYLIVLLVLIAFFQGCIEPYDVETQGFEGVLVVDARLTDEEKQHQILLSRARPFEQDSMVPERNAFVLVKDEVGNSYEFEESSSGKYESISAFKAQQNRSYELSIRTADGSLFNSAQVQLPTSTELGELSVERIVNDKGEEGVAILLDDKGTNNSQHRRFEYEETYRIIAPFYSPFEFEIIEYELMEDGFIEEVQVIRIVARGENVKTCYQTDESTNIILLNTENLSENKVSRFVVRFLNRNNYIISHRYSILVKQFSLTSDAFHYYNRLHGFSSSESVFSETQPGFLEGNMSSTSDESLQVLGYFEVSAVNVKRIYFNYEDLFPNESLPPYAINCRPIQMPSAQRATRISFSDENLVLGPEDVIVLRPSSVNTPLTDGIRAGIYSYWGINDAFIEDDILGDRTFSILPPYLTKLSICGDCTVLGSTEIPDFWIE